MSDVEFTIELGDKWEQERGLVNLKRKNKGSGNAMVWSLTEEDIDSLFGTLLDYVPLDRLARLIAMSWKGGLQTVEGGNGPQV